MDEKEAGEENERKRQVRKMGEKETSCMAGKGTDWESWVTTKDLSIGRTQTPRAHPGSCWVMARWVGWTTARKQDRMKSEFEEGICQKKILSSGQI